MTTEKFIDPVVAEVHASRASLLAAANNDVEQLMRQVAVRQQQSARRVIRQPMSRPTDQLRALEGADEPISSRQPSPHAE